jgi:predicted methyltransferase
LQHEPNPGPAALLFQCPLSRRAEKTLREEIERAGFEFVADADFLRHPEDMRTNIVFKNPTPNDEFVLKFRRP